MRALGSGLLGTLVGGAAAVFLLLSLPDHRSKAAYEKEMVGMVLAPVEIYNHTADYIHQSCVNGDGGGNLHAYSASRSGALKLPTQWRPGLTAKARWTTSTSDPDGSPEVTRHGTVVPIERYDSDATTVNVHFLPAGQVRLIVWNGEAGSAGYPGPESPQPPADWPSWLHDDAGSDDDYAPSPPPPGQRIPSPALPPRG